jgi:hypothetical protein
MLRIQSQEGTSLMDETERGAFRARSRRYVLFSSILILLLISVSWNIYRYRFRSSAHSGITAHGNQSAQNARTVQALAGVYPRADVDRARTRLEQLYREIDKLGRLQEQLRTQPPPSASGKVGDLSGSRSVR